jgi:21S rRNA (uridine2791-2'-O)-methyltransferase
MPARLPCAHHAFRAACEPAFTTRSLRPLVIHLQAQSQLYLALNYASQSPSPSLPSSSSQTRPSSSASSARWKTRQTSDPYTKSSKLTALKSRAAYKLLEINDKHKLFRAGQSVVDLGYAPGSWSQVAKNRVGESGRVVGIDVIPAQPPRGVSALQGDFLSEGVQGLVREFVREWKSGEAEESVGEDEDVRSVVERARGNAVAVGEEGKDIATQAGEAEAEAIALPAVVEKKTPKKAKKLSPAALDLQQGRVVDVVLSDMCAPFPGLELSSWVNSVNRPYRRMMNTSGNPFRDHAGSIVRYADLVARGVVMVTLTSCALGSMHGSANVLP